MVSGIETRPYGSTAVLPSKVVEDILLAQGVVQVVLAPYDVGQAQLVVVHRHREVHHRIDGVTRAGPGMGHRVHDAQAHEVPHRGVGVMEVGLDHQNRLASSKAMGQHAVEQLMGLLGRLVAVRTGHAALLVPVHVLCLAQTYERLAQVDQAPRDVVVQLEAVALYDRLMDLRAQPFQVLGDHPIGVGVDLLGVGVLHAVDVLSLVPLHVLVVEDRHASVSEVQRTRGTRRHPHDHLSLDGQGQVGQHLLALALGPLEQCGVDVLRHPADVVERQPGQLPAHLIGGGRDLLGPRAQLRTLGHGLAHDRLGIGLPPVEGGVLQRVLPYDLFQLGGHRAAHLPSGFCTFRSRTIDRPGQRINTPPIINGPWLSGTASPR